jgi:hypothetical protein
MVTRYADDAKLNSLRRAAELVHRFIQKVQAIF